MKSRRSSLGMVNLVITCPPYYDGSYLRTGTKLFDPFCGTGTLLVLAAS